MGSAERKPGRNLHREATALGGSMCGPSGSGCGGCGNDWLTIIGEYSCSQFSGGPIRLCDCHENDTFKIMITAKRIGGAVVL